MGITFLFHLSIFFDIFMRTFQTDPSEKKFQQRKIASPSSRTHRCPTELRAQLIPAEHFADQFFADFPQNLVENGEMKGGTEPFGIGIAGNVKFDDKNIEQLVQKLKNGSREKCEAKQLNAKLKGKEKSRTLEQMKGEYSKIKKEIFAVSLAVETAALGILITVCPFLAPENSVPIQKGFFRQIICAIIGNEVITKSSLIGGIRRIKAQVQNRMGNGKADNGMNDQAVSNSFWLIDQCIGTGGDEDEAHAIANNLSVYTAFYERLREMCSQMTGDRISDESLEKIWTKYESFLELAAEEFGQGQRIIARSCQSQNVPMNEGQMRRNDQFIHCDT